MDEDYIEREWKKENELSKAHDLSEKIVQCSLLLFDIEERKGVTAAGTTEGISVESKFAGETPANAGAANRMLRNRNKRNEFGLVNRTGIETVIANHFEMLVRDMNNEPLYEVKDRNFFNNEAVVAMPVVMESNRRTIVRINTRSGNNRTPQISGDVLCDDGRITVSRFSVNIETLGMLIVHFSAGCFERRPQFGAKKFEQSGAERIPKEFIIEMSNTPPEKRFANSPFGNEDMNVRIPLKRTAEGVKDTNKTGDEVFRVIELIKHTKDNRLDSMKKTVQ